jgi:hypothetical protein
MKKELYVSQLQDINKILRNQPVTILPKEKRNVYLYRLMDHYPLVDALNYKITIRKTHSIIDRIHNW